MLFDGIITEQKLEQLKRKIMREGIFYTKIERFRKEVDYIHDKNANFEVVKDSIKKGTKKMPTNAEMLMLYKEMVKKGEQEPNEQVGLVLKKIKVRSNSGIAVVSLLTKPFDCPGRCIYCPTEKKMPKSYLSKEPAAARALANNFDPYKQVTNRLKALQANGHPIDKIEIITIGGTWSFYHKVYQEEFISEIFRACNNYLLPKSKQIKKRLKTLEDLQNFNETAKVRVIGLSVETRPDYINEEELNRMRYLGVTKVEIGVQHLDNKVLAFNQRDAVVEDVDKITELMRDAGFKIVYHMMPNLPGSTPEKDKKMFSDLFNGKSFQPDMLKIYPCVVLKKSLLYKMWADGEFKAYSNKTLLDILISVKKIIPSYVRIIRVIRDIPATYIMAGSKMSNMRQVIEIDQKKNNWKCNCIRCREVRNNIIDPKDYKLIRIDYKTKNGLEIFLSFENKKEHKCASFVRLRLPNGKTSKGFKDNLVVLKDSALIRELHTYGQMMKIDEKGTQSQHVGFGVQLMNEAEKIAKKAGYKKVAVIAGVGVREYYRKKLRYRLDRTYMIKGL